ncbi:MAG TPA: hypothetical protein VM818_12075 [Vicinamibacterales bacterium]|nr:hypothetical protein [Vicinamibacterales bacterium]
MTTAAALFLVLSAAAVAAQEDPRVPKDSALVSISGCAKNGTFTVGERREDQPGSLEIQPGRRFRLNGPKSLLNEIKAHRRTAMQVTGLIRKAEVPTQGIAVAGGRVQIGGAVPRDAISDPARDPAYNQAVMDVRSWTALTGDCR